jgi:2-polyprenyl-6-hydroxyphenyl methylase / 3-demethylubiquinone-9 3-methyltransferase
MTKTALRKSLKYFSTIAVRSRSSLTCLGSPTSTEQSAASSLHSGRTQDTCLLHSKLSNHNYVFHICQKICMGQSTSNSSSNNSENAEVSKFSAMSKQWWDPNINPLIGMNVIRLEYIRRSILRYYDVPQNDNTSPFVSERPTVILPLNGMRVLDIGCGGGLLSESLARLGATHVVGIDPSIDLIAVAKKRTENDSTLHRTVSYIGGISEEQFLKQEGSNAYDAVFLLEVVEHVDNPMQLIETAVSLLRPGGLLFLSTINRTYKSFLLTIVGAKYAMRYLPPGTHNWKQYFSPQEIGKSW